MLTLLEQARGEVRGLWQRHIGTKFEREKTCKQPFPEFKALNRRSRGQQHGTSDYGRTRLSALPAISAALPPPQLIPRGKLGTTVWVDVLLSKYLYAQPTHRLCRDWRDRGLSIAQGTITEGLRTIQPLFEPLLDCRRDRLREADHWHADETDRHMFAAQPDKRGYRWHLWLFQSAEVAYFQLDPTRSAAVPMNGFGTAVEGVLSVDRYGAYQTYARLNDKVLRALCWAHQRRDILHWPSSSRSLAVGARMARSHWQAVPSSR